MAVGIWCRDRLINHGAYPFYPAPCAGARKQTVAGQRRGRGRPQPAPHMYDTLLRRYRMFPTSKMHKHLKCFNEKVFQFFLFGTVINFEYLK